MNACLERAAGHTGVIGDVGEELCRRVARQAAVRYLQSASATEDEAKRTVLRRWAAELVLPRAAIVAGVGSRRGPKPTRDRAQ